MINNNKVETYSTQSVGVTETLRTLSDEELSLRIRNCNRWLSKEGSPEWRAILAEVVRRREVKA